jgi:hypothetical protein
MEYVALLCSQPAWLGSPICFVLAAVGLVLLVHGMWHLLGKE